MVDVKQEGEEPEEEPSEAPEGEPSTPEEKPEVKEDVVPRSRLKEEVQKRKDAESKLQELSTKSNEVPEDEKKIWEILDKREQHIKTQAKAADEKLKRDLDALHQIHGVFDNSKLLEVAKRYGVYDEGGNIQFERALELYERLEGVAEPPKKKTPSSQRTGDKPKEEPYDVSKKTLDEIVEEAKREIQE